MGSQGLLSCPWCLCYCLKFSMIVWVTSDPRRLLRCFWSVWLWNRNAHARKHLSEKAAFRPFSWRLKEPFVQEDTFLRLMRAFWKCQYSHPSIWGHRYCPVDLCLLKSIPRLKFRGSPELLKCSVYYWDQQTFVWSFQKSLLFQGIRNQNGIPQKRRAKWLFRGIWVDHKN